MLGLAIALVLAVPPRIEPEPPPRVRPPEELRCIYEEAPRATRDAVASHMWLQDRDYSAVVTLLSEAQDSCRFRHHWDSEELMIAFGYAQSAALRDYARERLAAVQIDAARFARIYWAAPLDERIRLEANAVSRNLVRELLGNPGAYAADPAIAAHSAIYLSTLGAIERAERMWARQMPFNLI